MTGHLIADGLTEYRPSQILLLKAVLLRVCTLLGRLSFEAIEVVHGAEYLMSTSRMVKVHVYVREGASLGQRTFVEEWQGYTW